MMVNIKEHEMNAEECLMSNQFRYLVNDKMNEMIAGHDCPITAMGLIIGALTQELANTIATNIHYQMPKVYNSKAVEGPLFNMVETTLDSVMKKLRDDTHYCMREAVKRDSVNTKKIMSDMKEEGD